MMVSLANNRTSGTRGYFGFTDEHALINSSGSDDELIVDHLDLVSEPETSHKPVRTTAIIVFLKILYVCLALSAFLVPYFCTTDTKCGHDPLSLSLYIHGGAWFVLLVLDQFLALRQRESRLNGYLDFYRKTRNLRSMPLLINSCANAVMVVLTKLLDNLCRDDGVCPVLTKMRFVQILVSLECFIALIILIVYLSKTVKFNRRKALPDVNQEELLTSFVNSHSSADIGFRKEQHIDHVMERQADMIRYLRQHTETLARRNLALTGEIRRLKGGVDLN